MKTVDFFTSVSSIQLKENFEHQFGSKVNLEKYSREQLEDMRNKLRTRVFQQEGSAGYNDLLTNEAYQKDMALLQLLNTRIKEMLGEDIAKLRNKMVELSEAKKGVRAPKYTKKSTGTDRTGDGKSDFDDVQVARMTAGGVPKKKAIAKATGDQFKEGFPTVDTAKAEHEKNKNKTTGKFDKKETGTGTQYTRKAGTFTDGGEDSDVKKAKKVKEERKAEEKPSKGLSAAKKSATVKKAKAGGDIGKKGKEFDDVAQAAGGGKKGKKIAAAAMWKNIKRESTEQFRANVRLVNESLVRLINEDEEGKAKTITAASDMVNDYTSWMQRVGQFQTKAMIELADSIRADFGAEDAEAFKQAVAPALAATLETLTQQREAISNAVAVLAGEAAPTEPMGMEPGADLGGELAPEEPGMEPATPDELNPEAGGDEFGAAEGPGTSREVRESKEQRKARKLAEAHSIMAKLAK